MLHSIALTVSARDVTSLVAGTCVFQQIRYVDTDPANNTRILSNLTIPK